MQTGMDFLAFRIPEMELENTNSENNVGNKSKTEYKC